MRLEDYVEFNAEKFLKDLNNMRRDRDRKQYELDNLCELPSINNESGVRSSEISDPSANMAMKIIGIKGEIEEIDRCLDAYEETMSRLSADEREVILGFFEPKMPIWKFVRKWESEHYVGSTLVYRARRLALEKFAAIIADKCEM